MGQIISVWGIPKTDPLSYTMPSYPFVDIEWGLNVIWYFGYRTIGWLGITSIWAVIPVLTMGLIKPRGKNVFGWIFGTVLTWSVMISRYGIRPQVVTWLGLAIIMRWIMDEQKWIREKKWLPFLMLIWANLHAGFPTGLVVLGIWLINRKDFGWWFLGIAATLINPFGIGLWKEILGQLIQAVNLNSSYISEWGRFWNRIDLGFIMLLVVSCWLLVSQKRKEIKSGIIFTGLGVMALSALRHTPLFMIGATAMVGIWWADLDKWLMAYGNIVKKRLEVGKKWLLGIAAAILIFEMGGEIFRSSDYLNKNYPVGAVEFLKQKRVTGKLFNWYGWGGYIEWQMPETKVFIDGRMSNWYHQAPKGEANQAFKEYLEVKQGNNPEKIFRKYQIKTLIWPVNQPLKVGTSKWKTIYKDKVGMVLISNED